MKRKLSLVMAIILSLSLSTACDIKELVDREDEEEVAVIIKDKETDKVQRFSFSGRNDLTGLNPLLNTSSPDNSIHEIVFEGLVRNVTDKNGRASIKPGVAEDWDISQDGKRYIFYLRDDVRWSDGVPITSDDFVYTFRQMASPEVEATNAWLFDDVIKNFAAALYNEGLNPDYDKKPEEIGVRAVDGRTIEFILERPNSSFLELLDKARPVRQDKFEEWGKAYGKTIEKSLMNGQFVVEEWTSFDRVKMVKNKNYWNQHKVKLDTIERLVINDKDKEIRAFLDGKIDCVDVIDGGDKKLIEDLEEDINLINNPGVSPEFIVMNSSNEYLKNDKIRLAISLTIDRREYVEKFKSKNDEVLFSMIPEAIKMGDRTYADRVDYKNRILESLEERYPNPRKLLEEGLREEGLDLRPEDISLTYTVREEGGKALEEATWLKSRVEDKLGISIDIEEISFTDLMTRVSSRDYDMVAMGWEPDFNDPASLLELFNPSFGYFNEERLGWTGQGAKEYKKLLRDASNTSDNNERAYIFLEAEKILLTEAVVLPLYTPSTNLYIKGFVEGFNRSPHTSVDFTDIYTFGR